MDDVGEKKKSDKQASLSYSAVAFLDLFCSLDSEKDAYTALLVSLYLISFGLCTRPVVSQCKLIIFDYRNDCGGVREMLQKSCVEGTSNSRKLSFPFVYACFCGYTPGNIGSFYRKLVPVQVKVMITVPFGIIALL